MAATSVKFRQGSDFGALPAVAALRGKHCWGPISFMEVVGLLGHCLFMTPIYTFFDIQGVQLKVESKIQQTKMLVTYQRFGDLFLFG